MTVKAYFRQGFRFVNFLVSLLKKMDFIGILALRLYLAPIFFFAGYHKYESIDAIIDWFGSPDGLGLPFPVIMAWLATLTELFGSFLLVVGLGVRFIAIPLLVTMLVAITTVHGPFGWLAVSNPDPAFFANERVIASAEKLEKAKEILQAHGNYEWLTSSGNFVILNNGIEFAVTYLIMLLVLISSGGGRFVSLDDWLYRFCLKTLK